ncbi:MAG: hypothetical protein FD146_684 [Anaerolineaceae bacterium]|nr:MAG: hypothetical protein FD146_684 [Anaerolineaceae bacterium]
MKRLLLLAATLTVVLSACAPAATPAPTPEPPDIDATVGALAETMVAGTLTAIPTATLLPTDTPFPTPTLTPAATPTITPTIAPTTAPRPFACNPDGRVLAQMEFRNNSSQQVLAVLSSPICYREFSITPGASVTQTVPVDTYSYYGYIGSDAGFSGSVWLSDNIHAWVLHISDTGAILETP